MKKINGDNRIFRFIKRNIASASILGYGHFFLSIFMRLSQYLGLYSVARYLFHRHSNQVLNYLSNLLKPVLNSYKNQKNTFKKATTEEERIWICWLQGEELAPPIVKYCIQSIRQHSTGREVVVITHQNRNLYAPLPDYIEEKVENGSISLTHLSDILRASLLYHRGGIWVDSTIFMIRPFNQEWFNCIFYSRKINDVSILNPSAGRWTTYFMAGRKGNIVHGFLYESFLQYFKIEGKLLDYFLMDYILRVGYDNLSSFRTCIDEVPSNNETIDFFLRNSEKSFNKDIYDCAIMGSIGFKLTYKRKMGKRIGSYGATLLHEFNKTCKC